MSGWLDLTQLGLSPNQKHQALLGAPKIVQCGEKIEEEAIRKGGLKILAASFVSNVCF
jgi:hypothetical protein